MATTYNIDGGTASLAPFSVQWMKQQIGTDHRGTPIYAQKENVICRFPAGSVTYSREWTDLEDGKSHTITMLGPESLGFFDLSSVFVTVTEKPTTTDINSSEFAITITNATRPTVT